MPRQAQSLLFACVAAFALGGIGTGCSSCNKTAGPAASRSDMAMVPREANFVAMTNVKKLRGTSLWKRFTDVPDQTPEQKKKYDDFVKETGLDPLKQIDSVFLALPQATAAGEFAAIVRGGPFDEARLIAFMTKNFKTDGGDIVKSTYGDKTRYTDSKSGTTYAVFLDPNTLLLASDAWSKKVIDLAGKSPQPNQEGSAEKNDALAALVKKTKTDDTTWGAGIVPDDARQKLAANDQLKSAGSLKDVYLSADFTGGFRMNAAFDLGSPADATDLMSKLKDQITQSRQNSQVQLLGLARYFDGVSVTTTGPSLHVDVKLDQAGMDDLIDRLTGLLRSLGGAFGGAGGGGGALGGPGGMPGGPQ